MRFILFILPLFLLNVAGAQIPPELLFSDSFDSTALENDINASASTRQGGRLKPLNYAEDDHTSAGRSDDGRTFLDGVTKRLVTWPRNGGGGFVGFIPVYPVHSFIESARFIVEVTVEPMVNDVADVSTDWVGLQFGAGSGGGLPDATDGISLVMRGNREMAIFTGLSATPLRTLPGLPAGSFKIRAEVTAVDFDPNEPVEVKIYINDALFHQFTRPQGMRGNYVSLLSNCAPGPGTDAGGLHISDASWFNFFDNFSISAINCIKVFPFKLTVRTQQPSEEVEILLPAALTATKAAQVEIRTLHPEIAGLVGSTTDKLTLTIPQGSTRATFQVNGKKKGIATVALNSLDGVCVNRSLEVTVVNSRVRNTSFEFDVPFEAPGVGPITGWASTGNLESGVDNGGLGFWDNGTLADGSQIAFLNGASGLSQVLYGLTPGDTYWVQVFYNARSAGSRPTLVAKLGSTLLGQIPEITPAGEETYYFVNYPFIASETQATLEIGNQPLNSDATLLLDSVSVVRRVEDQLVLMNPGFEASGDIGTPALFIAQPLAGWQREGDVRLDRGGGSEANNGSVPDQEHVLALSGEASISQTLTDLIPGATYEISVRVNAKTTETPSLAIWIGENIVSESTVSAVGGSNPYSTRTARFIAPAQTVELRLAQSNPTYFTLLLDEVMVKFIEGPSAVSLTIERQGTMAVISWPANAGAFQLEMTPELGEPWVLYTLPIEEANGRKQAVVPTTEPEMFFRLAR